MKIPWVFILASKHYGTVYNGVISDLVKRVHQHKSWIPACAGMTMG
jgi:predicted GIY-YIG superfamily endonuclease